MPRFVEETLTKMVVKSHNSSLTTLTTICEKFNIQKGNNNILELLIY